MMYILISFCAGWIAEGVALIVLQLCIPHDRNYVVRTRGARTLLLLVALMLPIGASAIMGEPHSAIGAIVFLAIMFAAGKIEILP